MNRVMADRNGICKKDKEGKRKHVFMERVDCFGNHYESCDRCGALIIPEITPVLTSTS